MPAIYPYLGLGKSCREAMGFYQSVFGGELSFLKVADTPMAAEVPQALHEEIMHCELKAPAARILATALQPETPDASDQTTAAERVSLVLTVDNLDETQRYFDALGSGGKVMCPLAPTFFAPLFGSVTDKFAITWNIICEPAV